MSDQKTATAVESISTAVAVKAMRARDAEREARNGVDGSAVTRTLSRRARELWKGLRG